MRLNDEVLAVIVAISIVASVLGIALTIPRNPEPFTAIGLLNPDVKIGDYPREVRVGEEVSLNLYILNHMGYTGLFMYQGKIGYGKIPSDEPLNVTPTLKGYVALCHTCNITIPIKTAFNEPFRNQTLVFELYMYDSKTNEWRYTGVYVFLRLNVTEVALP
ncbi:MAG: DUF1616 domain-containing protein [Sulfolobales archaeon]|nr:DUF1616 domain-containing protein [Sulfolobales archaeon]MCX8198511.1 DUF1616 domain-containing protein [Sulfolobales archaeon]MDW8169586.1 DUF1616 domain-containing protein [Desulfurococcaceae archaeon]